MSGKGLGPLVLKDWAMRAFTNNEVTVEIREVEQLLNNVAVRRDDYEDLFDILVVAELEPPDVREIAPNDEDVDVRIQAEITLYRDAPLLARLSRHADEKRFPVLAYLARKILCIPATSAPSERLFSTVGLTIAKDRGRLLPELAEDIIFLHDA